MARVLTIDSPETLAQAVEEASALLRDGEVVVTPTETVYGLAANALNEEAVKKVFAIKGRPSNNPLIVHVGSMDWARGCASEWPEAATLLARAFWPGPLTLVLPRSALVPPIVTGGGSTVAVRWPAHPFMRALLEQCAFPVAAPSANLSTELSSTQATHAIKALGSKVSLVVDAGPAVVGIESTVVDLTSSPIRILRPGMITRSQIAEILKVPIEAAPAQEAGDSALRSPGLMEKHYAPKARLITASWKSPRELSALLEAEVGTRERALVLAHTNIPPEGPRYSVAVIPFDPEAYARALYAQLHQADEQEVDAIIVEALPSLPEWDAINDRLKRASAR